MKQLLIIALLTAASWAQTTATKSVITTDVSPTAPRFQLFVNPNVRMDTFLLDTVTGKIWQMTTITGFEDEPTAWVPTMHLDSPADAAEFMRLHKLKDAAKAPGVATN